MTIQLSPTRREAEQLLARCRAFGQDDADLINELMDLIEAQNAVREAQQVLTEIEAEYDRLDGERQNAMKRWSDDNRGSRQRERARAYAAGYDIVLSRMRDLLDGTGSETDNG